MSEQTRQTEQVEDTAGTVAHRWLWVVGAAALVLLADQLTKWWALEELRGQLPRHVIWQLQFNYAENKGMAFSQGASSGRWIGLVVICIVVALVVFAARSHNRTQVILLGVIIGGALGNLVDRAARAEEGWLSGAVVDFIDFQFWPVFNIADAAVVVGGLLLVLVSLREPEAAEVGADPPADTSVGPSEQQG